VKGIDRQEKAERARLESEKAAREAKEKEAKAAELEWAMHARIT